MLHTLIALWFVFHRRAELDPGHLICFLGKRGQPSGCRYIIPGL